MTVPTQRSQVVFVVRPPAAFQRYNMMHYQAPGASALPATVPGAAQLTAARLVPRPLIQLAMRPAHQASLPYQSATVSTVRFHALPFGQSGSDNRRGKRVDTAPLACLIECRVAERIAADFRFRDGMNHDVARPRG